MKTKLITILIFLSLQSCVLGDPKFHDYFIIINNCTKDINILVSISNGENKDFIITPQNEYLFFTEEWVGGISKIEYINDIFQTIIVTKDGVISKINYVDYKLWKQEHIESSHRAKYYTDTKYYLVINSEDFE